MSSAPSRSVDVRGPRFAAGATAVVLAVVLVTGSGWLVASQAVVFAVGAFAGLRYSPYGVLFRMLVAPREYDLRLALAKLVQALHWRRWPEREIAPLRHHTWLVVLHHDHVV